MVWNYVLSIIGELELSEIPRLPADIEYREPNNGSYTHLTNKDLNDNELMLFETNEMSWKMFALRNKVGEINVIKFTNFAFLNKDDNSFDYRISSCRHGSSRYKGRYTETWELHAVYGRKKYKNEDVIQLFLKRSLSKIRFSSSQAFQTFIDYLIEVNRIRVKRMVTWMSKEHVKCISKQGGREVTMFNKLEPYNMLRKIMEYI
jgi:hypothetical protein